MSARRQRKKARCPEAELPYCNGVPLAQWPGRVAVVAYGHHQNYGDDAMLQMIDASGPPGDDCSRMLVGSPRQLMNWASANQVWNPNITGVFVDLVSCQSQPISNDL